MMIDAQGAVGLAVGRSARLAGALVLAAALTACAGPRSPGSSGKGGVASAPDTGPGMAGGTRGGGYYLDDGPGAGPAPDIAAIPDAVPRAEPVLARSTRPYVVFGRRYVPMSQLEPYQKRGIASWYGRRYHGNPTSSGERYDMYAMTAAHPTLPLPSYVRVTSVRNGRSVVVRVNDRGPFLNDRLIDLSYTAAAKLGFVNTGSAEVDVELITDFSEPAAPMVATGSAPALTPTPGPTVASGQVEAATAATVATATTVATAATMASTVSTATVATAPAAAAPAAPSVASAASAASADPVSSRPDQSGKAESLSIETELLDPPVAAVRPTGSSNASIAAHTSAAANPPSAANASTAAGTSIVANTSTPAHAATAGTGAIAPLTNGYWLQFGAFASPASAGAARARMTPKLDGLGAPLDVVAEGNLYKLQAGPWPTHEAVLRAAEWVRGSTDLVPFMTQR